MLDIGQGGAAFLRAGGFEPEMVCGQNVLAMTSPCDAEDTLDRLAAVLAAYDSICPPPPAQAISLPAPGAARLTIAAALAAPARDLPAARCASKTAAEYVWAYPPGVPLLAPGEAVTESFLAACAALTAAGTTLHHSHAKTPGMLRVLGP